MAKKWVSCDLEAEYFKDDRKNARLERKMASKNDRSKYKKTDQAKMQVTKDLHANIKLAKEDLCKGLVLSITPQGIVVDYEHEEYHCSLRGLLKKDKTQFKNLVTVGDYVLFQKLDNHEGLIAHIEPRRSTLARADNLSRRQQQLIAANVDQVIITTSVVSPAMKPFLVDRYIIAAEKGNMTPIIVVNKIDLLESSEETLAEKELYEEFVTAYKKAGISVIAVSAEKDIGISELKSVMKDKISVFSGQSGVGKSSLINAITGHDLAVGRTVDKTNKGSHTTTTTRLLPLEQGGYVIDTPGIKSFGVWNLQKEEVKDYFPDIQEIARNCKFPNCSHMHEADCAVMQAVEEGSLSPLRFDSYRYLIESLSDGHVRR